MHGQTSSLVSGQHLSLISNPDDCKLRCDVLSHHSSLLHHLSTPPHLSTFA
ncbi:unnamed protein product [Periconia digitata]|uniref:Uncharacterized protein n=1 Tax=Periconia digitata TaxID=1303443 RepID=A0A9W4UAD5_9PLEO|nr:unnamed protein product [Periconia digitata]